MQRLGVERPEGGISVKRLTYRDANGEAWYSDAGTEANRLHFIADMEDILGGGYDLDRLRELAQADRDGRCVVLPCKQGDTVWRICGPKGRKFVAERKVVSVTMYGPEKFEIFTNCNDWLGKTVFLTREEAEKALKEGENNAENNR